MYLYHHWSPVHPAAYEHELPGLKSVACLLKEEVWVDQNRVPGCRELDLERDTAPLQS